MRLVGTEGVMSSIGVGVGRRWRCVWRRGGRLVPGSGTEVSNHVGCDAGGSAALTDATEECSGSGAKGGADVDGEVGGDFGKPLDIASGREVGKGVGEELEFHGDAIKEFGFVFIKLGEDGMLMLEGVLNGREMAVGDVGALASGAIGNGVVVKEVGILEDGGELRCYGGVYESIEVMEEGDGSAFNRVGFGDEGAAALPCLGGKHAELKGGLDEVFSVLEPDGVKASQEVEGVGVATF